MCIYTGLQPAFTWNTTKFGNLSFISRYSSIPFIGTINFCKIYKNVDRATVKDYCFLTKIQKRHILQNLQNVSDSQFNITKILRDHLNLLVKIFSKTATS